MPDLQVTCVTKPNRFSAHEHITHIGGNWTPRRIIRVEEAIDLIDSRQVTFYTLTTTGRRAEIRVIREPGKRPHLRTVADGYYSDNLLALSECSIA